LPSEQVQQRFNRSRKRSGVLRQSRGQARPIDSQSYLDRFILYIYLNPAAGGLMENPTDHVFGGHREIIRRVSDPVIDIDVFSQRYEVLDAEMAGGGR
jgi:hypothetical protein